MSHNSFGAQGTLDAGGASYRIYRLQAAGADLDSMPFALKVLAENLLRHEDGISVRPEDIAALLGWQGRPAGDAEVAFRPARVLMQDLTGVPAVADLAAMRDAVAALGKNPASISPKIPVDLVIDHSVVAERSGAVDAFRYNAAVEFEHNRERYHLLRWAQQAFEGFSVVPPDTGICHQVNLEYLSKVVFVSDAGVAYPDTLVGTDSHTTMVNGLGVLGWGVGGIEAEAAMLGQPLSMTLPEVVGVRLSGELPAGATATDLVLTIAERLRSVGVVGRLVEFFGPALSSVPLETRATIGNMSPEYGSTCALFPVDQETLRYLAFTGRSPSQVSLVEAYCKEQGMFHYGGESPDPSYSHVVDLDLSVVRPSISGPSRPQDRVDLASAPGAFATALGRQAAPAGPETDAGSQQELAADRLGELKDGSVVLAAITSCTNTSNPEVMVAAGLLAKAARAAGLSSKPWVKTSLAPGSKVVTEYLERSGLMEPLGELGFDLVGYGCTTCIGNSGPLLEGVSERVRANALSVSAVLSGNRNFEGRIHPDVRMNWLASPPLVVAYAIAGSMEVNLAEDPLGTTVDGREVYLKDLWPSSQEIAEVIRADIRPEMFSSVYSSLYQGDPAWSSLAEGEGVRFVWEDDSTYVKRPPFVGAEGQMAQVQAPLAGLRALAVLGDSVTTDHISPAGAIPADSPAGEYLAAHGVAKKEFNSYGARRGNHEVMMRGTFANLRLRNAMAEGTEGGFTTHLGTGEVVTIFEASRRYRQQGIGLVVLAGREYGSGSSRDWAAKGPLLLGVRAVIAESFERIHRSNLVGMGILPLQFLPGDSVGSLGLTGKEVFDIAGMEALGEGEVPQRVLVRADGREFFAQPRLDTPQEVSYFLAGGILPFVLEEMVS